MTETEDIYNESKRALAIVKTKITVRYDIREDCIQCACLAILTGHNPVDAIIHYVNAQNRP